MDNPDSQVSKAQVKDIKHIRRTLKQFANSTKPRESEEQQQDGGLRSSVHGQQPSPIYLKAAEVTKPNLKEGENLEDGVNWKTDSLQTIKYPFSNYWSHLEFIEAHDTCPENEILFVLHRGFEARSVVRNEHIRWRNQWPRLTIILVYLVNKGWATKCSARFPDKLKKDLDSDDHWLLVDLSELSDHFAHNNGTEFMEFLGGEMDRGLAMREHQSIAHNRDAVGA